MQKRDRRLHRCEACMNGRFNQGSLLHILDAVCIVLGIRATLEMDHAELYSIRRSEDGDQNGALELDSPSKDARRSYFGRALLGAVIETSFLALTATDPTRPDRVLGFAAFDSAPSGELNDTSCYPAFLEHKFELPPASAFLFLTYFAQRQTTAGVASRPPVLRHLLHTVFATLVNKRCVLLVLPDDVNIAETEPALAKFFERVPTRSAPLETPKGSLAVMLEWKRLEQQFAKNAKTFSQFVVYQAKVDAFYPPVHVRRARVEDHDDLEPILTAQAEAVSSAFGEYFLAELIHDQDEHNVCLIAEAAASSGSSSAANGGANAAGQGRAIGLLAISDQLDVSTLQDNFALGSLNDLSKSNVTAHNDADADIFRAVNESGLVYDGRLVVDGHMRTTDAHVLGAGTLCRFSRRFIAAKMHENYSSREGGELLARSLLQLLDPLAAHEAPSEVHPFPAHHAQPTKTPMAPPPEMEFPVVRCAVILGGKHYVQISVPALTNTLALQALPTNTASRGGKEVSLIGSDTFEMEMSSPRSRPATGASPSSRPTRYTCLLFDDVGVLNRLEYLGDGAVPVRDLQNLVGLHEAYLNSALASYAAGKVQDWVAFFAHPWASALYHDRFPAFRAKLRTLLAKDDGVRAIADDAAAFMRETGDTKGAMALAQERVGRGGSALEPSTRRLVESQVLEFLGSNRDVLNMFLLPKGGGPRPGSK
ncbi:adenylate kinase [Phytophthora cinnamomi]|uniref:adenylate kinase n=1 Tax=Phytophthora cinnamomi TaxID=4785 RepID=UPI00355AB87E|nr:adenylate kinase [Phytophthora cinnamomi]